MPVDIFLIDISIGFFSEDQKAKFHQRMIEL